MQRSPTPDLIRTILQILSIGILIAASFWIMKPFLISIIWAVMIFVTTWPFLLEVQSCLWGKRGLAIAAMTVIMLLLFIVPFSLAIAAIVENAEGITNWVKTLQTGALPTLPAWLSKLPVVGSQLTAAWESGMTGPEGLSARLAPYAGKLVKWFLSQAGSVGIIALQFILTMIITAILYAKGEVVSAAAISFARRIGDVRGEEFAVLAAKTVRGVALGVVVTALLQSFLGGLGLAVAGVPAVALLTAVMFIFCIAQLGSWVVLVPAVIWLYWSDQTTWGTVLLVWSVFVGTIDNLLRPFLIRKGADLPLLLIFAGVIGGLGAFGIVGLFVGPVVLSITFRLLKLWMDEADVIACTQPADKTTANQT